MNIIRKIVSFIKNIFINKEEIKELEEPKIGNKEKRENFIKSFRVTTTNISTKRRVETLICDGDGLGIQKKITC